MHSCNASWPSLQTWQLMSGSKCTCGHQSIQYLMPTTAPWAPLSFALSMAIKPRSMTIPLSNSPTKRLISSHAPRSQAPTWSTSCLYVSTLFIAHPPFSNNAPSAAFATLVPWRCLPQNRKRVGCYLYRVESFLISNHVAPRPGPRNPPAKQRRIDREKPYKSTENPLLYT